MSEYKGHERQDLAGWRKAALAIIPTIAFMAAPAAAAEWQALFNGKDLAGWQQEGGKAKYQVEGNEIIGYTVAGEPNSFLTTKKHYSDFILEYEMLVDTSLNSGVQIRSHVRDDGVVYGYQVEFDPTDRAFTGGIYDEKRRGWLYPLTRNEKGRKARQNGSWNHFRVEAIGNSIRVWVNGIQTVDLVDDMTAKGLIGLQVHSVRSADLAGITARWRNVRILTSDLEANRMAPDPDVVQISYLDNQLTDYEIRKGWRLLWDGRTTDGWRGAKTDHFPERGWNIEDGVLSVEESGGHESVAFGDIVTTDSFSNFELELEFLISEGANSGIKYFVDPSLNLGPGSAIGCEYQILDDDVHPDAKAGVAGTRTVASLYDMITPENLQTSGRSKQFKGVGNWNHARIVSKDGHVEHWLNNEKVVEFDRFSQMFRALVEYSKYKVWPGFCQWPDGRILLQDHGNAVSFKNIKVREL